MYWMTFCIVFYSFFKSATRFKDDFLVMLEDKLLDEERSYQYHKKLFMPLIGMTITISVGNVIKIYLQTFDVLSDRRLKLSYAPFALFLNLSFQLKQIYDFYHVVDLVKAGAFEVSKQRVQASLKEKQEEERKKLEEEKKKDEKSKKND